MLEGCGVIVHFNTAELPLLKQTVHGGSPSFWEMKPEEGISDDHDRVNDCDRGCGHDRGNGHRRREAALAFRFPGRSSRSRCQDRCIRRCRTSGHFLHIEILDDELVGLAFQKFECSLLEQRTFAHHLE